MKPVFDQFGARLFHGDCIEVMQGLPDASVHAVVTDPPYGLANTDPAHVAETISRWVNGERDYLPGGTGFMGKAWDAFVPPVAVWDECLRVLKPGGHLLAFAGSRTLDLMTLGIRLAGFEIRDSIAWLYGSGFPKSMDVSKAIDKQRTEDLQPAADVARWLVDHLDARGLTRRDVTEHFGRANIAQQWTTHWTDGAVKPRVPRWEQWQELRRWLDLPDDMDAEVWRLNGRKGTPGDNWEAREVTGAVEEWTDRVNYALTSRDGLRRDIPATPDAERWQGWGTALKPAFEPIVVARKPLAGTVAGNVLAHGTGALNIDGCRVGDGGQLAWAEPRGIGYMGGGSDAGPVAATESSKGRWPTNVILDDSQAAVLDEQSGESRSPAGTVKYTQRTGKHRAAPVAAVGDDRKREAEAAGYGDTGGASRFFPTFRYEAKAPSSERPKVNGIAHPTVKPLKLLRWMVRLVTPPGGTVLEPFAGSGTTLEAALAEGFEVIGIEREADYLPLIEQRLARPITPALDLGDIA